MTSPTRAPLYAFHKRVNAAEAGGPYTEVNHGVNMGTYAKANVQVVPDPVDGAGDLPVARILFWSAAAGQFIAPSTALTFGPPVAGVPFEFTVEANGRIMYIEITGATLDGTDVYVSGHDDLHPT